MKSHKERFGAKHWLTLCGRRVHKGMTTLQSTGVYPTCKVCKRIAATTSDVTTKGDK